MHMILRGSVAGAPVPRAIVPRVATLSSDGRQKASRAQQKPSVSTRMPGDAPFCRATFLSSRRCVPLYCAADIVDLFSCTSALLVLVRPLQPILLILALSCLTSQAGPLQ